MEINLRSTFVEKRYTAFKKFFQIYQFVVKFFIYIMLDIKFNIIFIILIIFRYAFNFIKTHYIVIKRIFRYLKKIIN